jgi:hypothetical protein
MKWRKFVLLAVAVTFSVMVSAHPGIGLVEDSKGNLYYTNLEHVYKIDTTGEVTLVVENVHTHELYIDASDNLYGEHEWYEESTDSWKNYVWCLGNDGELEKVIPAQDELLKNTRLVRDTKGNSYWVQRSDGKCIVMRENSTQTSLPFTDHLFNDIRWMHYSKEQDALYLVDGLAIMKVNRQGTVSTVHENVRSRGAAFHGVSDRHYVFGLWTDNSFVYVAIFGGQRVLKFDRAGEPSLVYSSPSGWSPCSGLISRTGQLWVMECNKENEIKVKKVG